jgi:DedD protein
VRDDHRIKDRYELSLDNRQIVTFFVSAIVVISTVFVLGVVVGKKLAAGPGRGNAPDLLSALDEKAAAMEQVKTSPAPEARLTFPDELTKKPLAPVKESSAPPEAPAEPPKVAMVASLPVPAIEKPTAEASNRGAAFTLQLSASQAREDADRFAARLRAQGYHPYIVESDVKDRGRWYRVRMGKFSSKEAAAKFLDDFHRETKLEAFVTSAN